MGRGTSVLRSVWVFFVVSALQIINQQLSNQYVAIKVALGVLDLDTFLISDFFPKPDARFNIVNALTGLGTILSVVSGFVSIIEPGLAAIGTILPTVGSFLGNAAASKSDPLVGQKESAPKVQELYNNYFGALDEAGTTLFQGGTVRTAKGGFNITDMMAGGAWVNSSSLTRLRDMETNLTVEILSRSIDALWKTPPSNKICNFIEDGDKRERGYISYPWGGNLLQEKLELTSRYRLAKRNAIDPFNVTGAIRTETFLAEAVKDNGTKIVLLNQAGRYPGSWTLPVCDASTWGQCWNWDYGRSDWDNDYANPATGDFGTSPKHQTYPPCLCGEKGGESDAWAKAAGMQDFETFHVNCKRALGNSNFQWPDGVTEITYTGSEDYTIRRPGS
ncbi:MAG: hypothetical protein L6R38_001946 [Xanthoria sp. 2 TBL-2021]|nr:MAG: hypothetical protein L6R38_001946 [Xanthoria sp. 2 TBL-2021]